MNASGSVWITGTGGLVGANLLRLAPKDIPVVGLMRQDLDLTNFKELAIRYRRERPSLVIHCAAMSKSVECEANPALARKINVETTAYMAELMSDIDFFFFSTDLIFDGRKGNYIETDAPNPLNIYGETKLEAEQFVTKNPRHTIIRLALCGGESPKGNTAFNEVLQSMWRAGNVPTFFSDEYRSAIAAHVAARVVWSLANRSPGGIFHLGGKRLSRVELGQLVAGRHPELSPKFNSGSLRDYNGPPRAPDTGLCCDKIQKILPFPIPGLDEWLAQNPQEKF